MGPFLLDVLCLMYAYSHSSSARLRVIEWGLLLPSSHVCRPWKGKKNKTRVTNVAAPACYSRGCRLAHTAGHLQLDQAVQLNRVLHGEFPGDRLNEAVDDQRVGLGLIQATAHQVEELVVTDFRDGRLVANLGLKLVSLL